MSLDCSHTTNNNVKTCSSEDVLVTGCSLHLLRRQVFSFIHTRPLRSYSPFPAATGWHVGLAWWSAGFLGGGLQSGSTAGSRHLPLLLCTLAVRSKRAQREHGGVRENTNRAPIVLDLGSTPPHSPTSRGLRLRE